MSLIFVSSSKKSRLSLPGSYMANKGTLNIITIHAPPILYVELWETIEIQKL